MVIFPLSYSEILLRWVLQRDSCGRGSEDREGGSHTKGEREKVDTEIEGDGECCILPAEL